MIRDDTQGPRAQIAAADYEARFAHKLDHPDSHMLTAFINAGKETFDQCFFTKMVTYVQKKDRICCI